MAAILSHLMAAKPSRLMANQDEQEGHIKDVHMENAPADTVMEPRVVIEQSHHANTVSESAKLETSDEEDEEMEDDEDTLEKSGTTSEKDDDDVVEEDDDNDEDPEEEEGEEDDENEGEDDEEDEEESSGEENEEAGGTNEIIMAADKEESESEEEEGSEMHIGQSRLKSTSREVKVDPALESEDEEEEEDNEEDGEEGEEEEESDSDDTSTSESGSSETDASVEWEEESNASPEVEPPGKGDDPNRCIFCEQDEENDPSEEFEEYLACAACGDNAHRQCARDATSLLTVEENTKDWRCPSCVKNGIEADVLQDTSLKRRRSSAPKITRDLLPVHKGANKSGAHSIFNTLILHDDPLDGSRSLRKRKSSESVEEKPLGVRKRRRTTTDNRMDHVLEGQDQSAITDDERDVDVPTLEGASAARPRSARARTQRKLQKPAVSILQNSSDTLLLSFNLHPTKLANLANEKRKRRRRDRERERRARLQQPEPMLSHYPALQASSFATPYYSLFDKDGDGSKTKPYGGILTEEEADTSGTFPQSPDRRRFEDARLKAEDEWRKKIEAARVIEQGRQQQQKTGGPPSKIKCINFGGYEIDTWHAAPYPEEYSRNRVLYICEFCLKYLNSDFVAWRHKLKCPSRHPPGDEIYRDNQFSFFEVDGRKNPVYCQNLCLLAKLFLGSKTLYYDVEPFLFYVMTENDEYGCHFVGYFSKEKRPSSLNNVSCILVLPIHQRRGFGHMLIEFSYLLTRVEKKTGSPEKPLSDMGLVSYRSYWRLVLCYELLHQQAALSISDISDRTGMTADDIVCALEGLRSLVRDPITKTYALRLDYQYFRQYIESHERKGYAKVNSEALTWVPYVMGRDNSHYENAAPLHTVAQREEETNAPPEEGVQLAQNGISEKDYAETKTEGNTPSVSTDIMTPQEELADQMDEAPTALFPSFGAISDSQDTPSKNGAKIHPSTPWTDGAEGGASPIPATRFEIFPPVPGSGLRKRPGRPPLGRGARRGTPLRRDVSRTGDTPFGAAPASAARTRSKLSEAINGLGGGTEGNESDADGAHDTQVDHEEAEGSPMEV